MTPLLRSENWPVGWPLTALTIAAVLYHLGGRASSTACSLRRSASFYGGLLVLALAVDSPVDAYADRLFFVHMLQHVLLTMVAPPLLLLGRPWPRVSRAFPLETRRAVVGTLFGSALLRRVAEWVGAPLQSFVLFNGVLLAWHVPALYDLTLRSQLVHDVEHALFFATALLFWRHLAPSGRSRVLSDPARVAYGTGAILVGWGLAVVLAFAPGPVYEVYAALPARPLGLSALGDQQLAAGIMWVPASVPYTIAVLVAAYRWLDPAAGRRRPLDLRPRET
jgi:putative membrane protein